MMSTSNLNKNNIKYFVFTITAGRRRPLADTVRCMVPALFGGGTVNVPARVAGVRCHGAVVVAPRSDVGSITHIERIYTTVLR